MNEPLSRDLQPGKPLPRGEAPRRPWQVADHVGCSNPRCAAKFRISTEAAAASLELRCPKCRAKIVPLVRREQDCSPSPLNGTRRVLHFHALPARWRNVIYAVGTVATVVLGHLLLLLFVRWSYRTVFDYEQPMLLRAFLISLGLATALAIVAGACKVLDAGAGFLNERQTSPSRAQRLCAKLLALSVVWAWHSFGACLLSAIIIAVLVPSPSFLSRVPTPKGAPTRTDMGKRIQYFVYTAPADKREGALAASRTRFKAYWTKSLPLCFLVGLLSALRKFCWREPQPLWDRVFDSV